MRYLKLFESFNRSQMFSSGYEQMTNEDYEKWRSDWIKTMSYLEFGDRSELGSFTSQVKEILNEFIPNNINLEVVQSPDTGNPILKVIIVSVLKTGQVILMRPYKKESDIGFVLSIFGPTAVTTRFKEADGHFVCEGEEGDPFFGLHSLLEEKSLEGYFSKKPKDKKVPVPYKSAPVLSDSDFSERGLSGVDRAEFYKVYGKQVRDLGREEALSILGSWIESR